MDKRPDIAYIRRYVNGELSHREMFEIEKAAHEDELLMDIILGLEAEKQEGADIAVATELHQQIRLRSENTPKQKTAKVIPWRVIGIAASLLLVFGVGVTLWYRPDIAEYPLAVESPVATDDLRSGQIDHVETESVEEEELSLPQPGHVVAPRRKEEKTIAHVPNIIELELPQPRHDRGKNIPFGIPSSEPDSVHILASAPVARSRMVGSVSSSDRSASGQQIMIRGVGTQNKVREGSHNITNIPVDEIKSITTGIVVDQQTQQPVVGAVIKDLKTKNLVHTDSTGRFVIASTEQKTDIQVDYIGFESATLAANGSMRIELHPAEATLEEVVVSGYRKDIKKIKNEPAIGTRAYRRYVDNAAKDTGLGRGTVVLIFDIDSGGRPINIRVKQSAGTEYDQQAIRIVKDGPDWIPGNDGEEAEWKVSF